MRKSAAILMTGLVAFAGWSCGGKKWEMPKVEMPKVLRPPTAEEEARDRTARIHRQIDAALKAEGDAAFLRETAALLDLGRELNLDHPRLMSEAIAFAPQLDGARQERLNRYHRLLETLGASRMELVEVAAPRLASTEPRAAETSQLLLRWAAPPDPRGRVDFSSFQRYLENHRTDPPQELIAWMYRTDPSAALWTMAAVFGGKVDVDLQRNTILGEHVVSEIIWRQQHGLLRPDEYSAAAAEQIDKLSQAKEWWTRMYAAQVLASNPALGRPEVLNRLRGDSNPLVSRLLAGAPK